MHSKCNWIYQMLLYQEHPKAHYGLRPVHTHDHSALHTSLLWGQHFHWGHACPSQEVAYSLEFGKLPLLTEHNCQTSYRKLTGELHVLLSLIEHSRKLVMLARALSLYTGSQVLFRPEGLLLKNGYPSHYAKNLPGDSGKRREVALCMLLMQLLSMHIHLGTRLSQRR